MFLPHHLSQGDLSCALCVTMSKCRLCILLSYLLFGAAKLEKFITPLFSNLHFDWGGAFKLKFVVSLRTRADVREALSNLIFQTVFYHYMNECERERERRESVRWDLMRPNDVSRSKLGNQLIRLQLVECSHQEALLPLQQISASDDILEMSTERISELSEWVERDN